VAGGALAAIPGMGQFGFALSIAGTAIGSAMEDLTEALKKPEENIENLVNKLGLVGTPTGDLALQLEKVGATSSAARLLLDEFNEKMGKSPEELLETTKKLEEFKNKVNELGTEITLFLSSVLIPFIEAIGGALDTRKLLRMLKEQEGTDFFRTRQDIVNKANERAAAQFKTNQAMGVKNPLSYTQLRDQNIDILLKEALGLPIFDKKTITPQAGGTKPPGSDLATQTFEDREIVPLKQALEIEQKRLSISGGKLTLMKEEFKLTNLQKKLDFFINEEKQFNNGLHDKTIQKLKAEVDLQKQVVQNAEKLINLEDKKDLELFLKENAKEMRSLEDEDQKNYDDAIKKLDNLKKSANAITENMRKQNELNLVKLTGSEYDIALAEVKIGLTKEQLALFDEEAFKIAFNNKLRTDALIEQKQLYDEIGASIEKSIVGNLTDAVMGTQTLGQAAVNVLNNLKRKIIEVQIEQAVSGIGKGIGGFLGNLFKRERGGPVSAGGAYLVGEKGPEILQMGSRGGNIIPNNAIGGGGTTNNMITVNVDASGTSVQGNGSEADQLGGLIASVVQATIIDEQRAGGLLNR
jgi:hypothetical protein